MNIYPAIDLFQGKAVRLFKGDYAQMTVYSEDPARVAMDFQNAGAAYLHLVDLEGARSGSVENLEAIRRIVEHCDMFVEVGGGIRSMETVDMYLSLGVDRVIIGTAAVKDPDFLREALLKYGTRIAVGVDLKDGYVAVNGWTESSGIDADSFFSKLERMGVHTVICTDISRDGAMKGTNRALYRDLSQKFRLEVIASGGVSTLEDIRALRELELSGAIIGKAYYTGAIDLSEALEAAK